jgi:peptidoglycan/xylan/chitin deacetylase (PgdA/CDA1 family)
MVSRRLLGVLLASSVAACGALSGCAVQTDAPEEEPFIEGTGDGDGADEIVSEHQLNGSELPDRTIALTFDDGPGPRTKELAEYLATEGIRATFFINGRNVPGRQSALDAIVGRGHLLANHTQNHLQLTKLSSAKLITEITQTDVAIAQMQPSGPWLVRPPFGAWSGATARNINATAMRKYVGSVFWDVGGVTSATSAADWDCWGKKMTVDRCGSLYMTEMRTKKRGIVLMHDVHSRTVDMVKLIVPKLKAEGWKFANVTDAPAIKRALASNAAGPAPNDSCSSATLGRSVPENTCVQARSDQKWHRCADAEWLPASGPSDAKCTAQKFPLP